MGSRLEPPHRNEGVNVVMVRVLDGVSLRGWRRQYRGGHGRNSFPVDGFAIPRSIESDETYSSGQRRIDDQCPL